MRNSRSSVVARTRGLFERKEPHTSLLNGRPVDRLVADLPACHSAPACCLPQEQRTQWFTIAVSEI